jgi:hypothetical protein
MLESNIHMFSRYVTEYVLPCHYEGHLWTCVVFRKIIFALLKSHAVCINAPYG